MARLHALVGETLVGGAGYYDYELEVGRKVIAPWLSARLRLEGLDVGDFGCHAGGVLQAIREGGGAATGEGFDLDERAVRDSPFPANDRFSISVQDVLTLDGRAYDLIILHDVLEHVSARGALLHVCARSLRPGGSVFVSFPPYYSPFGGHQHVSANWTRLAPYIHLLPSGAFFRLVELTDNEYLGGETLRADLEGIRAARVTIDAAEGAFNEAGFDVAARELFLLRPEYAIRYGIKPRSAGVLGSVRGLRELLVMGAFYLLRPSL